MKTILPLIIVIFLFSSSYTRDIRRVNRSAGLKHFKVGLHLRTVLRLLTKYKLKISDGNIYNREINIRPYKLIRENISNLYKDSIKENTIVISIKHRKYDLQLNKMSKYKKVDYFIDLLDTIIDTKNYLFFNKDRKFRLQYKKIQDIIIKGYMARHINPYLQRITFHFIYNTLYRIRYSAFLNLDQIARLISNYKSRYRITKIGNGINIFYQHPYYYKLKLPDNIEKLLNRIHALREDDKKYSNHEIFMDMYHVNLVKKVRLYKSYCYDNFLDKIITYTIARINRTRKAIKLKLNDDARYRAGKNTNAYDDVDDL